MSKSISKVNMKLPRIVSAVIIILTIFTSTIFIGQTYAQVNRDNMPIIDDGMGNGSYGKGKNASQTLDDFIKGLPFFFFGGIFPGNPNPEDIPVFSTPTPTPIVGTPPPMITTPPSLTGEGQYADLVVQYAKNYCNSPYGVITKDNYGCVDSFAPIMNEPARHELKISAASYTYAQCVAGVRSMSRARDRTYNGYGNAIDHAKNGKDPNYTYYKNDPTIPTNYQRLKPGSIVIHKVTGSIYGHIAYVTQVNGNPNDIDPDNAKRATVMVYEVNWGPGVVRHDRPVLIADLLGWQTPNSL